MSPFRSRTIKILLLGLVVINVTSNSFAQAAWDRQQQKLEAKARAIIQSYGLHSGQSQSQSKATLKAKHFGNPWKVARIQEVVDDPIWECESQGWQNGRFIVMCLTTRPEDDDNEALTLQLWFEIARRAQNPDSKETYQVQVDQLYRVDAHDDIATLVDPRWVSVVKPF